MQQIIFGAGCFWGVEDRFRQVPGVKEAVSGYSGGQLKDPTYKQVCTDKTGHAEVVQVDFDQDVVSVEQLIDVFFSCHNPTTKNRQGVDVGSQYRSVIFYHNDEQRQAAEKAKAALDKSGKFKTPVVTDILPATVFYRAEEYHQRYFEKNGQPSCHI